MERDKLFIIFMEKDTTHDGIIDWKEGAFKLWAGSYELYVYD